MIKFVLVIHLLIAAAMIAIVLLQKSEGGALGIGGGGGGGGFLSGRGTANLLTRLTAGLAAAFFVTSLTLTILAGGAKTNTNVFKDQPGTAGQPVSGTQPGGTAAKPGSLLNSIQKGDGFKPVPSVPQNQ